MKHEFFYVSTSRVTAFTTDFYHDSVKIVIENQKTRFELLCQFRSLVLDKSRFMLVVYNHCTAMMSR